MVGPKKGKSGSRKYGRNLLYCKIYRSQKRREKSHIRRIKKHLLRHIEDRRAKKALVRYELMLK